MLKFSNWLEGNKFNDILELVSPGEPEKEEPTKVGGTNAFGDFHNPGSSELPPDKPISKLRRLKLAMKKGI